MIHRIPTHQVTSRPLLLSEAFAWCVAAAWSLERRECCCMLTGQLQGETSAGVRDTTPRGGRERLHTPRHQGQAWTRCTTAAAVDEACVCLFEPKSGVKLLKSVASHPSKKGFFGLFPSNQCEIAVHSAPHQLP